METNTFTRNLTTALTAPVFTDRPELVAPFAAMCADIRSGIDGGKFAPAPVHMDATGEVIDLRGNPSTDAEDADERRHRASLTAREVAAELQIAATLAGFEYLDSDDANEYETNFGDY